MANQLDVSATIMVVTIITAENVSAAKEIPTPPWYRPMTWLMVPFSRVYP